MAHEICRVTSFKKIALLLWRYSSMTVTSQMIDFRPVLAGELYGPLQDARLFDQVSFDREVRTLVWPNGADCDPAILHNWPESGPALKALAVRWGSSTHSVDESAT